MAEAKERTIEDRIKAIEDRLAIYNLVPTAAARQGSAHASGISD